MSDIRLRLVHAARACFLESGVDGASLLVTANLPSEQSSANPEAGGQYRFGPLAPGDYLVTAALASNAGPSYSTTFGQPAKPSWPRPSRRTSFASGSATQRRLPESITCK